MREQWYCKIVGQEVGPVTSEDLLSMLDRGQIDLGDEVRAGTSGPWRRVSDVLGKPSRTPEPATVATASAESSGDEYGFLNDIARLEDAGGEAPPRSRRSSDDLLAGLADLEDADAPPAGPAARRSSDELLAGLADLEDAGPPPPPAFVPPFAPAAPPADPAARAEMLRRLDAEYQRLRHQLAGGPPAAAPPWPGPPVPTQDAIRPPLPPGGPPGRPAVPSVKLPPPPDEAAPSPAAPAAGPAVPRQPAAAPAASFTPPPTPAPPPTPPPPPTPAPAPREAIAAGATKSAAADVFREMAAAQVRASQTAVKRPAYAPSSGGRSGGGGGFDLSGLNVSGKQFGIAAAVVGVLLLGYFGMTSGLLGSFRAGSVYDETAKLYAEFKTVAKSGSSSPEFVAFHGNFKNKQQELLSDLGTPSRGSTADEVARAVRALGTVIEAHRRPEISEEERQPFIDALDQQMAKLKQTFGR